MYNKIKTNLPDAEMWIAQQWKPPSFFQLKQLLAKANDMVLNDRDKQQPQIHLSFTITGSCRHEFRVDFTRNGMKLRYGRSVQLDGVKDVDVILAEIDALIRLNVY